MTVHSPQYAPTFRFEQDKQVPSIGDLNNPYHRDPQKGTLFLAVCERLSIYYWDDAEDPTSQGIDELRVQGYSPNKGESNGQENGELNGNWGHIVVEGLP